MLAEQFQAAAAAARNTAAVDEVARLTWRAHAEGQLDDVEAQSIGEALQSRRLAFSSPARSPAPTARSPARAPARRRAPRSPDRQASIERRRRQAMSGVVPARIAARFTVGELAVLTVIARQCQRSGVCVLPVDAIAALAGVCRTVVQNALRQARKLGLVLVKERRIPGQKSLTNVVRVISREWLAWIGFRKLSPTDNHFLSKGKTQELCRAVPAQKAVEPTAAPQSNSHKCESRGQPLSQMRV